MNSFNGDNPESKRTPTVDAEASTPISNLGRTSENEVLSSKDEKAVLNRLARIVGHILSIKKMIENKRNIEDVLVQISAVKSALNGVRRSLLVELLKTRYGVETSFVDFDGALTLIERYMKL